MSEAPPFWWQPPDWRARSLWPASALYGLAASRAMRAARREKVPAPVLCVGNLTVGGAGKTPVANALAEAARRMRLSPGFLSRGYGGQLAGPKIVDPGHDTARAVGDEPLLLARTAPVAVTPNRAAGAKLLIAHGCDFLIMDDGFQSARIHMDFALIVVDARRGIGNGHVIPAGPMRAPLIDQIRRADAVLKLGEGTAADIVVRQAARAGKPLHEAHSFALDGDGLRGRRLLAFAGIGDPEKFFASVRAAGGEIVRERRFADHHPYSAGELAELLSQAEADRLDLVTTAKDAVRIGHGYPAADALLPRLCVLEIGIRFEPETAPRRIVEETLLAYEGRG